MFALRKRYKQYLEPGSIAKIPPSTLRRWRKQGQSNILNVNEGKK